MSTCYISRHAWTFDDMALAMRRHGIRTETIGGKPLWHDAEGNYVHIDAAPKTSLPAYIAVTRFGHNDPSLFEVVFDLVSEHEHDGEYWLIVDSLDEANATL